MKNIYLKVNGEWKLFESPTPEDFSSRGIAIGKEARIGEGATIDEEARIGKGVMIGEGATIGEEATIGEGAMIGEGATIGEGARINHALYIIGGKHLINYCGNGKLRIGCYILPITEWQQRFKEIGENEGYTPEQIEEYRLYIELAATLYKDELTIKK